MTAANGYRKSLETIMQLTGGGESLFLVGGTVRDMLLRRGLTDFDVTGAIDPRKLGDDFARATKGTMIPIGWRFGTVRVVNEDGIFDFSAMRGANIHRDLGDRDITINAMAYPFGRFMAEGFDSGAVIDPLKGREDLKKKIVRALSEDNLRDDPVRIFRVYRFASAFGFSIDEKTRMMVERNASSVQFVSGERARDEIFNTFQGRYFDKVLKNTEFIMLVTHFAGTEIDTEAVRKRVLRLTRRVKLEAYDGVREIYFREVAGGRRAIDGLILFSLFFRGSGESLPLLLFRVFRLSRKERNVLARVAGVLEGGLFPPRGASPIRPEAVADAGPCLPHVILFADGVNAFANKRNMVQKTIKYYLDNRNLIEKREMPWISGKFFSHHLIKRVKNPKETMRELMVETLAGAIESEQDALALIDNSPNERGNG
jgi:hypothetical protein